MNQPKLEPSLKMNNGNATIIGTNPNIVTTGIVQTPVNGNAQIGAASTTTMFNIIKGPTDQKPIISVNASPLPRPQGGINIIQAAPPNSSGISIASSGQPPIVIASTAGGQIRPMAPQQAPGTVRIAAPAAPQQQIIIPRGASAIQLPPGVSLPPGTILMQNDKGQIVFMSRAPAPPNHFQHQDATGNMGRPTLFPNHPRHMHAVTGSTHPAIRNLTVSPQAAAAPAVTPAVPTQMQGLTAASIANNQMHHRHQHPLQHVNTSAYIHPQSNVGGIPIQPNPNTAPTTQIFVRPAMANISGSPGRPIIPAQPVRPQIVPATKFDPKKDHVHKCKSFLETLMRLSADQPKHVIENVKKLIQGLLDDTVTAETFTNKLQKELDSKKQPGLTAFLKASLPSLRDAIRRNELSIDGLPPPHISVTSVTNITTQPNIIPVAVPIIRPAGNQIHKTNQNQSPARGVNIRQPLHNLSSPLTPARGSNSKTLPTTAATSNTPKGKQQLDLKDDDDINDVATMGGVNLSEETKNILAAVPESSGQLRSCRDAILLSQNPLVQKIRQLVTKKGLKDVNNEVINLVSHACEERLRHLVEKVSLVAEHRLDIYRVDKRYEASHDVRSQLKFLEELDKLERKKHEDSEREVLLKAAKSRPKSGDTEQAKLKKQAKEMKEQELEEQRQIEANKTALAAIGPRKKRNYEEMADMSSSSSMSNNQIHNRPRLKRVNIRDLAFVLEEDKEASKTRTLFKCYLK